RAIELDARADFDEAASDELSVPESALSSDCDCFPARLSSCLSGDAAAELPAASLPAALAELPLSGLELSAPFVFCWSADACGFAAFCSAPWIWFSFCASGLPLGALCGWVTPGALGEAVRRCPLRHCTYMTPATAAHIK